MILDTIVRYKKKELEETKEKFPLYNMLERISFMDAKRSFCSAFKGGKLSIIAEVKRASPSKGIICESFNALSIAEQYIRSGVDAISVLTEKKFFLGCGEYLERISNLSDIPTLRKDFIIDEYQIYEAKLLGASAILLITAILDERKLKSFLKTAMMLSLDCLVEVHNEDELTKALSCNANIIGINNRDLKTFEVDIAVTEKLIRLIPDGILKVSESGISSKKDMNYLKEAGADGVLIGEAIIKSRDIGEKLKELRSYAKG